MKVWIPRTLRDDGMIMVHECYGHHQCEHTYVRVDDHQADLAEKEREIERLQGELAIDLPVKEKPFIDDLQRRLRLGCQFTKTDCRRVLRLIRRKHGEAMKLQADLAEKERELETKCQDIIMLRAALAGLQADLARQEEGKR